MNLIKYAKALDNIYLSTKRKPWPLQKPVVIQFPVDDICNAKCQMCNIWKQKFDYHISPDELRAILSNPLFSEVLSVGINGGEPTLRRDLAKLVVVIFETLPKVQNISLITNGLNSQQVIERISQIGEVVKNYNGKLDVMVSLDGVGDIHDKVRGRNGNFNNALKVIDFIQSYDSVTSKRLGCTVIKENVYDVENLLDFAISNNIYIKYRLGIPHQRLYSQDLNDPFNLCLAERYHFSVFLNNLIIHYDNSQLQKFFYRSLIGQLMYQNPRIAGCDWQHRGVTLSSRGEILYCAVASKTLGSALTQDSSNLYFGNQSHLNEIIVNNCDSCSHDYVGLPPTKILLQEYAEKFINKVRLNNTLKSIRYLSPLLPLKNIITGFIFRQRMANFGFDFHSSRPLVPSKTVKLPIFDNTYKIMICGWYGTETLGDKAILGGVIESLKRSLGKIEVHLVSLELYISQMTASQMIELENIYLYSIRQALEKVSAMNLVVFGGGPLMAINNMAEMVCIFQKATTLSIPTLIAGCGVGPLGKSHHNKSITTLLKLSSFRIYRDRKSLMLASSLGVDTTDDLVSEDPALSWVCYNYSNQRFQFQKHEQPTLILGLRDWPYDEYAPWLTHDQGKKTKENFEFQILLALELFCNEFPDFNIIPFPMCTNHIGGDDRWFYRKLFRTEQSIINNLDFTYLSKEITPLDALKVFASSSLALTMRFHSLVFALGCNVPTVSIDYTLGKGKVKSLSEKSGIESISLDKIEASYLCSLLKDTYKSNSQSKSYDIVRDLNFFSTLDSVVKPMVAKS